ncbi:Beta-barrel assembly machine subunit BamC [Oceanospirillum multiglobuliferum]|uniref:Outer membrane protein assembly factor BamC n=1 Tax=Oceanospirillum multiglobuliferum TaxID=64969 RepID=A0A1T4LJ34_9GAMM|nr:hypothetical protein [Oceanospirillum multiglobuliferum]OPX56644.1 hypothetical protein BTE48_01720 [Oceanospirillum multiglobuliferum]SJZ54588.1 Beta-barrel assembly machine subunit BamC [Oceanospirillum multiglobuliferum]
MSKQDLLKGLTGSLVLSGLLLSGCSSSGFYHDRKTDYVDAKTATALKLPAQADHERFREAMPLPSIQSAEKIERDFVAPRPDPLPVVDVEFPAAELQEYGAQGGIEARLWLSMSDAPAVAWPLLQQQFERLNWATVEADPTLGHLVFIPDNQKSAIQVQARLRQGIRGGFSDLELLDSQQKVRTDNQAKTLLNQLKTGLSEPRLGLQSVSLLAQKISNEKALQLNTSGGQDPVLSLGLEADRVWIGLEKLLQSNFIEKEQKLVSSDVLQRSFNIVWVPEADRSSFLTRWARSPGAEFQYQLQLSGSQPVTIRVLQNGQPIDPKQARLILTDVRNLLN